MERVFVYIYYFSLFGIYVIEVVLYMGKWRGCSGQIYRIIGMGIRGDTSWSSMDREVG